MASGQAGLETGPRGGRAHPSPPRGSPVLGGRPAGSAGLLGGLCPHRCSAGGREGGRPVQGGAEGPRVGSRLSCRGRGPRSSATCLPGAALRPPDCVCLCWLRGSSLLLPSERLVVRITAHHLLPGPRPPGAPGADPRPQSVSPWTRGALRSWLEGLAGLEHHRSREKQDVDGGPASRRRPQVSSIHRDPGREGPGTLPAGGLTSRKRWALPSGWGGGRWWPSHQGCGLSWRGASMEEVAAWWAQCSWDLGAGGRGSDPGRPGRGVGGVEHGGS